MPNIPTYAPRTDFGQTPSGPATPPPKPAAPVSRQDNTMTWNGDVSKPPPGIPANFWNYYISQPNSVVGQMIAKLKGGTAKNPQQIWANIVTSGQQQWNSQSPENKKTFETAQASGNPHNPFTTEGKLWTQEADAKSDVAGQDQLWKDFQSGDLEGIKQTVALAAQGNKDAIAQLESFQKSIHDPELSKFVGDYTSQGASAFVDPETIAAQKRALTKAESLYDPNITAEERLMQETSRLKQEQDLKAQRGAFANNLQERGVYGGGAELTMNLAASQQAAQQRAMDEMAALANAQKRSMSALELGAKTAGEIRTMEGQETQYRATAADKASEFNKTLRDHYNEWIAKQQNDTNKIHSDNANTLAQLGVSANNNMGTNAINLGNLGVSTISGAQAGHNAGMVPVHKAQDTGIARTAELEDFDRIKVDA